jgi:SpoVK/Ycf46/Vps4 family AAA+-type ATPase
LELLEEFRHGDTLRRHGLSVTSKLLFCGPPGCGKTLTAEIFAKETGLPLLVARLDAIISSFLGETASNLRKLFEEVERRPCVLFLDEFDALARTRGDGAEHNEMRRVVNSLLMLIDRYKGRGFIIAATNVEESLDDAIWRRFDDVIVFELPEERQILRLIELKTRNFSMKFDLSERIKRLVGFSYADIERVCVAAIKRSVLKGAKSVLESEFDLAIAEGRRRRNIRAHLKQG